MSAIGPIMLCESNLYCAKHERRIVWYCPQCHEEWKADG